jgi:hypothetical protein
MKFFRNAHGHLSFISGIFFLVSSISGVLSLYFELFNIKAPVLMLLHNGKISDDLAWIKVLYTGFLFLIYTFMTVSGILIMRKPFYKGKTNVNKKGYFEFQEVSKIFITFWQY